MRKICVAFRARFVNTCEIPHRQVLRCPRRPPGVFAGTLKQRYRFVVMMRLTKAQCPEQLRIRANGKRRIVEAFNLSEIVLSTLAVASKNLQQSNCEGKKLRTRQLGNIEPRRVTQSRDANLSELAD